MKNKLSLLLIVAIMVCIGIGFLVVYERQQPLVLCEVVWQAPPKETKSVLNSLWFEHRPHQIFSRALAGGMLPDLSIELIHNPDATDALKTTWKGSTILGDGIAFLNPRKLTPGAHYAFIGEIRRENINSDCRLGMNSLSYSSTTVNDTVKQAHIASQTFFDVARNNDWQSFALLVDESRVDFNFAAFNVSLSLGGPNTFYLRNLKFVQYPNGTNPLRITPSFIEMSQPDIRVTSGFPLLFGITGLIVFFLIRRFRRIRHERELRRIASLDS